MTHSPAKTVAIIGAGPVGLAAAAHVLERGMTPLVLEQGSDAAHAVRQWGHVRMFSPWSFNIDAAARRRLAGTGWRASDTDAFPTGADLIAQYLDPLAASLRAYIRTGSAVVGISRSGFDKTKTRGRDAAPFALHLNTSAGNETVLADAVIDASGTWSNPAPAGADGLPATGEHSAADRIELVLPETGICSRPLAAIAAPLSAISCCGGPPKRVAEACCAADETAKVAGATGCGCPPAGAIKPAPARASCC